MEHEQLIIQLIQQDLKHNKLTQSLLEIGLVDGGLYDLEILTIVSQLMGVQNDTLMDSFTAIYCSFLCDMGKVNASTLDKEIPAVANHCYGMLKALIEIENRVNNEAS